MTKTLKAAMTDYIVTILNVTKNQVKYFYVKEPKKNRSSKIFKTGKNIYFVDSKGGTHFVKDFEDMYSENF